MILATRKDKSLVVQILTEAFQDNLQINWIVAPADQGREKRLRVMMELAFESGLAEGEVYLTDNRKGVAVWKTPPKKAISIHDVLTKIKFALWMGPARLARILRLKQYIRQQHPSKGPYLHLWFLGVKPEWQGQGLSSQLLNPLLGLAQAKGMPVLLESSNPKNVSLYEHKGFSVYHQLPLDPEQRILIRFMRRG